MAEDAFQRRNGWPMLLDDVGHLNGQLKESILEVKRRRQINHAHFYDFGVFIFSRENGVTDLREPGSIPSTIGISGPFIGVNPIDSSHHDRPVHDSSIGFSNDSIRRFDPHFGVSTSRLGGRTGCSFVSLRIGRGRRCHGSLELSRRKPPATRGSPLGPASALESAA